MMGLRLVPGVTSTLAMFPLETVRTRLAVDHKTYRNVFTAFRLIFGQEGVPAFYRVGTVHLLPPSPCFVLSRTFAVSVSNVLYSLGFKRVAKVISLAAGSWRECTGCDSLLGDQAGLL